MDAINAGPIPLRVLIVDDEPHDATFITHALQDADYAVTMERVDTEAAMATALARQTWDVVLCDHSMPQFNSVAALKLLREMRVDTPCIVVSGAVGEETAVAALHEGASDYVRKDHLSHLAPAVTRVLCEAEARRARVRAENALRDSELRYRTLTESAFDLICEIDAEWVYTYVSPNHRKVLGFAPCELLGHSFLQNLHPDDRAAVQAKFSAIVASSQAEQCEFRYCHKNGEWRWLECTVKAIPTLDEGVRIVAVSRDITHRKRHEQEWATLVALAKAINARNDLPAIVQELEAHLKPLLPFDWIGLSLLEGDDLHLVACSDPSVPRLGFESLNRVTDADRAIWEIIDGQKVRVDNQWQRTNRPESLTRAFISVPLVTDGQTVGMLHFDSTRPDVFTEHHARLAGMVGEQVAVTVRQTQLLAQTRHAEEKFRTLVHDVDAIAWEADPNDFRFTFVSPQAEQWFGYPIARWQEDPDFWAGRIHPDDRNRVVHDFHAAARAGCGAPLQYRMVAADQRVLWLRHLVAMEAHEGKPVRLHGLMFDITGLKRAEAALLESNAVLKATQEAAADGICLVNLQGRVVSCNQRFIEMWGIPDDMVVGLHDRELKRFILNRLKVPDEFSVKVGFADEDDAPFTRYEVELQDGRVFERYSAPALAIDDGGLRTADAPDPNPQSAVHNPQSYGRVWSFRDITERKQYEQQLEHQAFHDPLTGLPNRALFMEQLTRAIARADRSPGFLAMMFLDLDRFKVVNDSLGHEQGDRLLVEVAQRLKACLRPGDMAARFGGDEFTILLEDVISVGAVTRVAERIAEHLQAPLAVAGHEVYPTASIGIVLSTDKGDHPADLLRHADVAMYRAKHRGGACYAVFDTNMSGQAVERLKLELDLRHAVKRQELLLHYQPLVDLSTGRIIGMEALVRWLHPERGIVSPLDFIPLAEETGLILPIGQWVLREACSQARRWQASFPLEHPFKMSVNLSAKQFQQAELVEQVAQVLQETGLEAHFLELEITESAAMEDAPATVGQLQMLKRLGVQLAIDDFGTGYSSLSYLQSFPLDVLKIDRAFVHQIGLNGNNGNAHNGNENGMAIMRAVHALGQALRINVTAEGVENEDQMVQLRALECQVGQGFHFSRPLCAGEMEILLGENPQW